MRQPCELLRLFELHVTQITAIAHLCFHDRKHVIYTDLECQHSKISVCQPCGLLRLFGIHATQITAIANLCSHGKNIISTVWESQYTQSLVCQPSSLLRLFGLHPTQITAIAVYCFISKTHPIHTLRVSKSPVLHRKRKYI